MKTRTVDAVRYQAGDPVPAWLLDQEPTAPDSTPATITFIADADVIDTGHGYIVVPANFENGGAAALNVRGASHVSLFSPAQRVMLITGASVFFPVDEPGKGGDMNY